MISNYVFRQLSLDSIDFTAADVLPTFQARYPEESLTTAKLPEYAYKSLKTLLGETDNTTNAEGVPNWAIRRIRTTRNNNKFQQIETPDKLPLVMISVSNEAEDRRKNIQGAFTATVEMTVFLNPETANSTQGAYIAERIRSLFVEYTESGIAVPRDIAASITSIKGLLNLYLTPTLRPESGWDFVRQFYAVEGKAIQ